MTQPDKKQPVTSPARRSFIALAGAAALAATAAGLVGPAPTLAAETKAKAKPKPAGAGGNVPSFNRVLELELELVAAYRAFPGTGHLNKTAVRYAETFLGHHQTHVERLSSAIKAMGGKPAPAKSNAAYAKSLKLASLKNAADVMTLALRLEKGAADAYCSMIAGLGDPVLAQVIARLGADAAMHWGVIADALGTPIPQKAMSFGA